MSGEKTAAEERKTGEVKPKEGEGGSGSEKSDKIADAGAALADPLQARIETKGAATAAPHPITIDGAETTHDMASLSRNIGTNLTPGSEPGTYNANLRLVGQSELKFNAGSGNLESVKFGAGNIRQEGDKIIVDVGGHERSLPGRMEINNGSLYVTVNTREFGDLHTGPRSSDAAGFLNDLKVLPEERRVGAKLSPGSEPDTFSANLRLVGQSELKFNAGSGNLESVKFGAGNIRQEGDKIIVDVGGHERSLPGRMEINDGSLYVTVNTREFGDLHTGPRSSDAAGFLNDLKVLPEERRVGAKLSPGSEPDTFDAELRQVGKSQLKFDAGSGTLQSVKLGGGEIRQEGENIVIKAGEQERSLPGKMQIDQGRLAVAVTTEHGPIWKQARDSDTGAYLRDLQTLPEKIRIGSKLTLGSEPGTFDADLKAFPTQLKFDTKSGSVASAEFQRRGDAEAGRRSGQCAA